MKPNSKVYIAGHTGMMGSAFLRQLEARGQTNILTRTRQELDLTNQAAVNDFFEKEKPEYVFVAAAKVGGIMANATYPADFIYLNLAIQTNIIHAAYVSGVKRLLFLGSVCIYPKHCPQPIKEDYLLTGALEPTNEPYAIAKIAGLKMCEAYNRQYGTQYLCAMPTNLYGTGDNFDLETSHVLPALIRKFHELKVSRTPVTLWGTGQASREFLHVDDCANACIFFMDLDPERYQSLLEYPAGPPNPKTRPTMRRRLPLNYPTTLALKHKARINNVFSNSGAWRAWTLGRFDLSGSRRNFCGDDGSQLGAESQYGTRI
jgi:GDP-L-fucose synthase